MPGGAYYSQNCWLSKQASTSEFGLKQLLHSLVAHLDSSNRPRQTKYAGGLLAVVTQYC